VISFVYECTSYILLVKGDDNFVKVRFFLRICKESCYFFPIFERERRW